MPLVVPTPIPAYPPAPQPTDDRVSFSTKAFALAASYEPQRVAFNTTLGQVNTNAEWAQTKAQEAQAAAAAAEQSASDANASRIAVDHAVNDVSEALEAIKVGPVASVNGRTGVVAGLAEAATTLAGYGITDSVVNQVNGKQGTVMLRDHDIWLTEHSAAGNNGQVLQASTSYSLYTVSAYSRSLPDRPSIGTRIKLHNLYGTWGNALFTLTRPRANVTINNVAENVIFDNGRIPFVTLEYIWEDVWTLG